MLRSVRWMALASLLLLCTAGGTYYLAEHKSKVQNTSAELATADQSTFSGLAPDTNRWHVFALLSLTAGLALAAAMVLVLRQDRRESMPSIGFGDVGH